MENRFSSPEQSSSVGQMEQLSSKQRLAAKVKFTSHLIDTVNTSIESIVIPSHNSHTERLTYSLSALELFDAKQQGEEAVSDVYRKYNADTVVVSRILDGDYNTLLEERESIYDQAQDWGLLRQRKELRAASYFVRKLPLAQQAYFYDQTKFHPYGKVQLAAESAATGVTNFATSWSSELVAVTAGAVGGAINPFSSFDTKTAVACLAASYGFWGWGLIKNGKANWSLLESTGISSSFLSKIAYESSKRVTDNEKVQKGTTFVGFTAWEVAKEGPYYAVAFPGEIGEAAQQLPAVPDFPYIEGIPDRVSQLVGRGHTNNNEIAFLAFANLGAAAWNFGQAWATNAFLRRGSKQIN